MKYKPFIDPFSEKGPRSIKTDPPGHPVAVFLNNKSFSSENIEPSNLLESKLDF